MLSEGYQSSFFYFSDRPPLFYASRSSSDHTLVLKRLKRRASR